ncbi:MAG: extracellular solute-binding protein [Treponema sp.]|nr:extracellular solute-binding protein [Treponema sp.]
MKFKKILFILALVAFIVSPLWAGGRSARSQQADTAILTELSAPVQIVMWHMLTDHQQAALQRIVDTFNSQNPMVTVVLQSHPRVDFEPRLLQAVRNNIGPDMVHGIFANDASNFVAEDYLIDFSPYINHTTIGIPNFRNTIPPGAYADITQWGGDSVFLIPVIATGPVFFYNKTLYDRLGLRPPTTWTELEAQSRIIVRETGRPAFGPDSLQDLFHSLIMQGGSGYIDVNTRTVAFDNAIALEKLTWFSNLVQEGIFRIAGADMRFSNLLGSEAVAAYIGSSASIDFILSAMGGRFELGVAPIPVEGPVVWVPTYNFNYAGFRSTPERELAVYEFYKYFMSPEVAAQWAIDYDAMPIPIAALNSREFQAFAATKPSVRAISEQAHRIGGLPAIVGSSTVRNEVLRMMEAAALGTRTPAQALADAVAASNRELQAHR